MKKITAAILLAIAASSAQAYAIRGTPSCGEWIEGRSNAKGSASGSPEAWNALTDKMWYLGYLSGLAAGAKSDFLRHLDNDSIFVYTDNYCRANPLKNLAEAGFSLALEAAKR